MNRSAIAVKGQPITEPPGGWQTFVDSNWERQPLLCKDAFSSLFVDLDCAFRALAKATDNVLQSAPTLKNIKERHMRFYIEHSPATMGVVDYLPKANDKSLAGYADRISTVLSNRDFTLVTNNIQAYDFELWQRVRRFISGLYAIIGMPLNSQVVVYVSKAQTTAVGVHKDPNGNFLFQLCGHKKFRLWPSDVFKSRPHLVRGVNYEEIADEALSFELGPGDLLYMPSDYYHLAEADNQLSVHLSIIVDVINEMGSQIAFELASQVVTNRLRSWKGHPFFTVPLSDPNGLSPHVPSSLATVVDAYADLDKNLEESMINELTRRSTSLGCKAPPPLLDTSPGLADDDMVEADPESPIAHHVLEDQLYFAANGHGFACPAHPNAVRLIQEVGLGHAHSVRSLLNSYSGTVVVSDVEIKLGAEDIRHLLETLVRIRAIRRT